MTYRKRTNNDVQQATQTLKIEQQENIWEMNSDAPEEEAVPAAVVAPVVFILLQAREMTGLWLRHKENIRDHLWHRCDQVMMKTANLSKKTST